MRRPFRRERSDYAEVSAASDEGPASSSPGASAPSLNGPPAWSVLPPIRRTIGPVALRAQTGSFVHSLATQQPPPMHLEPLGHHVDLATGGLVTGLASIVARHETGPEPIRALAPTARGPLSRMLQRRHELGTEGASNAVGRPAAWLHESPPDYSQPPTAHRPDEREGARPLTGRDRPWPAGPTAPLPAPTISSPWNPIAVPGAVADPNLSGAARTQLKPAMQSLARGDVGVIDADDRGRVDGPGRPVEKNMARPHDETASGVMASTDASSGRVVSPSDLVADAPVATRPLVSVRSLRRSVAGFVDDPAKPTVSRTLAAATPSARGQGGIADGAAMFDHSRPAGQSWALAAIDPSTAGDAHPTLGDHESARAGPRLRRLHAIAPVEATQPLMRASLGDSGVAGDGGAERSAIRDSPDEKGGGAMMEPPPANRQFRPGLGAPLLRVPDTATATPAAPTIVNPWRDRGEPGMGVLRSTGIASTDPSNSAGSSLAASTGATSGEISSGHASGDGRGYDGSRGHEGSPDADRAKRREAGRVDTRSDSVAARSELSAIHRRTIAPVSRARSDGSTDPIEPVRDHGHTPTSETRPTETRPYENTPTSENRPTSETRPATETRPTGSSADDTRPTGSSADATSRTGSSRPDPVPTKLPRSDLARSYLKRALTEPPDATRPPEMTRPDTVRPEPAPKLGAPANTPEPETTATSMIANPSARKAQTDSARIEPGRRESPPASLLGRGIARMPLAPPTPPLWPNPPDSGSPTENWPDRPTRLPTSSGESSAQRQGPAQYSAGDDGSDRQPTSDSSQAASAAPDVAPAGRSVVHPIVRRTDPHAPGRPSGDPRSASDGLGASPASSIVSRRYDVEKGPDLATATMNRSRPEYPVAALAGASRSTPQVLRRLPAPAFGHAPSAPHSSTMSMAPSWPSPVTTPAAQAALAAGVATPAADGSLVFNAPGAGSPSLQRLGADVGDAPAADTTPPAVSAQASSPSDSPAPAAAPALPTDDRAMDEFVRRAYGRISDQLRWQLLIDRERAGLLTDLHG